MPSRIVKHTGEEPFEVERPVFESIGHGNGEDPRGPGGGVTVGGGMMNIEKDAYERGFATGEAAGFDLGKKKADAIFQGLGDILRDLSDFKKKLYQACEKEVLDLSFAIARRVINREVECRRDTVVNLVKEALKVAVTSGEILIRLNPVDIDVVKEYGGDIDEHTEGFKGVVIEGDETVQRGGCVIETNFGEVDATIDGLLNEVEETLRNPD